MFSKILMAQVVTVIVALLVVTVVTRLSLAQGLKQYLVQQETRILGTLTPALADLYQSRGSWDFLVGNPRAWDRIWRQSQSDKLGGPGAAGRTRPFGRGEPRTFRPPDEHLVRWMRSLDRPMIRGRLFLLDENKKRVAGADIQSIEGLVVQAIEGPEGVVGWVGFAPMGNVMPLEAQSFLDRQLRLIGMGFLVAMVLAIILGYLLARQLSRPVRQLSVAVNELTEGHYESRADVRASDETGKLAHSINKLAQTLQKNRSARQRWMADIAHELRTPVSILKGEIEAMADGVRPVDGRVAASLGEEVDQLAALIDDLQALALSDEGALDLNKEPLDLVAIAKQSFDVFRPRLAERRIQLETSFPDSIEFVGDPQRMRQLLHNLLENSCRYASRGGRVCLLLSAGEKGVDLLLEDTGPGVNDEQLGQLFERFYRAEGSRSRATGGSGLGLSICRNIVEAHGGTIGAGHSSMGGLAIRINLPIA